jgi:hypothetical protein
MTIRTVETLLNAVDAIRSRAHEEPWSADVCDEQVEKNVRYLEPAMMPLVQMA